MCLINKLDELGQITAIDGHYPPGLAVKVTIRYLHYIWRTDALNQTAYTPALGSEMRFIKSQIYKSVSQLVCQLKKQSAVGCLNLAVRSAR